jgi:hypothetical protein
LVDDFEDAEFGRMWFGWTVPWRTDLIVSNGHAVINPHNLVPTPTDGRITSASRYSLLGSSVVVDVAELTEFDDPNVETFLRLDVGELEYMSIVATGGNLYARQSGQTDEIASDYVNVPHRFWKIEEADGWVTYSHGDGASDYNVIASFPTPDFAQEVRVSLGVKNSAVQVITGAAYFESVNLGAPPSSACPPHAHQDTFEGGSLDPMWASYDLLNDGCTFGAVGGGAQIAGKMDHDGLCELYALDFFDLRNAKVTVEIKELPTDSRFYAGIGLWVPGGLGGGRIGQLVMDQNQVWARWAEELPAYTSNQPNLNHRWLQIRHDGSDIVFEARPAVGDWVEVGRITAVGPLDLLGPELILRGNPDTEVLDGGVEQSAAFDHYNLGPP